MNIDEFNALEKGDRVDNPMSQSSGTVVDVIHNRDGRSVRVRWGEGTPGRDVAFTFTPQMRAWTHWEKVDVPKLTRAFERGGYVHAVDQHGQQMPAFQGPLADVQAMIEREGVTIEREGVSNAG